MNLTVGALMMIEERVRILSPSDWYLQSAMGFVYKEQNQHDELTNSLLAPFHQSLWLLVLGTLILPVPLILKTKMLTRKWRHFFIGGRVNRTPILNMCASALGRPISNPFFSNGRFFGNFARTLLIHWIIIWFFVRTSYEGILYNNLQSHQSSSPHDRVAKVINSNCKIVSAASTFGPIKDLVDFNR